MLKDEAFDDKRWNTNKKTIQIQHEVIRAADNLSICQLGNKQQMNLHQFLNDNNNENPNSYRTLKESQQSIQ